MPYPASGATGTWSVPADSLSVIAERHGVSLGALAAANGIDLHRPLLVGVVLTVPGARVARVPQPPRWSGVYVVRPGDTPSGIAARFGVSVAELLRVDGSGLTRTLLPGMRLHVPRGASAARPPHRAYVVRPGDTLSGIALRFGVSLGDLVRQNGIDLRAVLPVGARLRIPEAFAGTLDLAHVVQALPYARGAVGFDISFPDCERAVLPSGSFGIVGLNGGRPFTTNPCLGREYGWAASGRLATRRLPEHRVRAATAAPRHAGLPGGRRAAVARPGGEARLCARLQRRGGRLGARSDARPCAGDLVARRRAGEHLGARRQHSTRPRSGASSITSSRGRRGRPWASTRTPRTGRG